MQTITLADSSSKPYAYLTESTDLTTIENPRQFVREYAQALVDVAVHEGRLPQSSSIYDRGRVTDLDEAYATVEKAVHEAMNGDYHVEHFDPFLLAESIDLTVVPPSVIDVLSPGEVIRKIDAFDSIFDPRIKAQRIAAMIDAFNAILRTRIEHERLRRALAEPRPQPGTFHAREEQRLGRPISTYEALYRYNRRNLPTQADVAFRELYG